MSESETHTSAINVAPCFGCEKRTLGCHGKCEDYLAFSAARREYNDKQRLLADAENAARTMAFEGERRMEKRRRNR